MDGPQAGAGSVHLAELQYSLAASCRATPRLRHAWLATLADHHARHAGHDEVTFDLDPNLRGYTYTITSIFVTSFSNCNIFK